MNPILYQQILQAIAVLLSAALSIYVAILAYKQLKLQQTEVRQQNGRIIELLGAIDKNGRRLIVMKEMEERYQKVKNPDTSKAYFVSGEPNENFK